MSAALASARLESVAVVLDIQGKAAVHKPDQIPSRSTSLKILSVLKHRDKVRMEPGALMTLSELRTGKRYRLSGPLALEVRSDRPLKPGPGVMLLANKPGREALMASRQVNVSQLGGPATRALAVFYVENEAPPVLDLSLAERKFEARTLQLRVHKQGSQTLDPVQASLVQQPGGSSLMTLDGLHPTEGSVYWVYLNEGEPDQNQAFKIIHLGVEEKALLKKLESELDDLPGKIELYETYLHFRLFTKADELLARMAKEHPKALDDWDEVVKKLTLARKRGTSSRL